MRLNCRSSCRRLFFLVKNECEAIGQSIVDASRRRFASVLIYMPNGFSPNNDGNNDCFRGYIAPNTELLEYQLLIFDRWGNQMFETHDIEAAGTGIAGGQEMDPAVFVWFILHPSHWWLGKVLDIFQGDVTVIK
ncbi:MAG: gliding motility-associated C-terminal domain-containing protein [Saprospiraceae bacterium]